MSIYLPRLGSIKQGFPPIESALTQPDGLLAYGGCLSVARLKKAYQLGIFPWFNEGEEIMWWSPSERAIIELKSFHLSRSLEKQLKKHPVTISFNLAFEQVIRACILQRQHTQGTWITPQMEQAYIAAHQQGVAHSVEVWRNNQLIGGLYGVMQSAVFCGESMFHRESGASKIAMWALTWHLRQQQGAFIDCQMMMPHLATLGAKSLSRATFLAKLQQAQQQTYCHLLWQPHKIEHFYDATQTN